MIGAPDLLYIVIAICILIITGMAVAIGVELLLTLSDIRRIAADLARMTRLVERAENKVIHFLEKKFEQITK